jgi:hypothetical protein
MRKISILITGVLVVFAMMVLTTFIMLRASFIAGVIVIAGLFFWLNLSPGNESSETTNIEPKNDPRT